MIWMIKKIYIYVISMILLNGLVGSISYLCFHKIRQQLERKGLISMCITVLGVVSLKRLLNQSILKSWSSKMIKKSLEAYFFTLKNKIVFCKKQF